MKIKVYFGKDRQWHIRVSGKNNRILLDAAGYNSKRNAQQSLKKVIAYIVAGHYRIV